MSEQHQTKDMIQRMVCKSQSYTGGAASKKSSLTESYSSTFINGSILEHHPRIKSSELFYIYPSIVSEHIALILFKWINSVQLSSDPHLAQSFYFKTVSNGAFAFFVYCRPLKSERPSRASISFSSRPTNAPSLDFNIPDISSRS